MQEKEIQDLFHRYMQGAATPNEEQALKDVLRGQQDDQLLQLLQQEWNALQTPDARFAGYDVDASWQKIVGEPRPLARVYSMRKWSWAAAAAVVLLGGAGYFLAKPKPVAPAEVVSFTDVAPGGTKATLTLADGSVVTLDSAGNQVLQQAGTTVTQQGGELVYDENGAMADITYNTLQTPRGGIFRITLQDGTRVWLNAASALRYPTAFNGKERVVEITGEAYFEVARDARRPFKVQVGDKSDIQVLGTTFNVHNYADETVSSTTLLSGAIRVSAGGQTVTLEPGQQALLAAEGLEVARDADLGKVIAWKSGAFDFDNVSLQDAMREIARWYDIDVVYENGVPPIYFGGKLPRNISLNDLLAALEVSGVRFRIDGKKLIVTK